MCLTYSDSLSQRMNRDVQRIMDTKAYMSIFPDVLLPQSKIHNLKSAYGETRNTGLLEILGPRGSLRTTGIGGAVTGMGAHFIIIDDPIKGREQALSVTTRENVWDSYVADILTRLESLKGHPGGILVTQTRWHEDDLAGRLLANEPGVWTQLTLPAIRETLDDGNDCDPRLVGDALWPNKMDLERLDSIRKNSSFWFSALFQQRPTPPEGNMFKRGWFQNYYRQLPDSFDIIIQSWDMAFKKKEDPKKKKSDYVTCAVIGKKAGRFYLIDMLRERMNFPETKAAVRMMHRRHPNAYKKVVEDKANGPAIISELKDELPGLIEYNPGKDSKESRANAASAYFEAGNVYLPEPGMFNWVDPFVEEMVSFPNGTNDDQVDAVCQGINYLVGGSKNSTLLMMGG